MGLTFQRKSKMGRKKSNDLTLNNDIIWEMSITDFYNGLLSDIIPNGDKLQLDEDFDI